MMGSVLPLFLPCGQAASCIAPITMAVLLACQFESAAHKQMYTCIYTSEASCIVIIQAF